jgi:hypothetical protein
MLKDYIIINGPSKFELMLALFHTANIEFKTECGQAITVMVTQVKKLNDDGHDAWSIKGFIILDDGDYRKDSHECRAIFSSKNRKGKLTDLGLKNMKFEPEYLDRLSDDQLRNRLASDQKITEGFKAVLEEYMGGLNPHDRLIAEIIAAQELALVTMDIQSKHSKYTNDRSRKTATAV